MSHSSKIIKYRLATLEEMMINAAIHTKIYMCCEHTRKFSGMIKKLSHKLKQTEDVFLS